MNKSLLIVLSLFLPAFAAPAAPLECEGLALKIARDIFRAEENSSVTVKLLSASEDISAPETSQTFLIQGFRTENGVPRKLRVPARLSFVPGTTSCVLFSYDLPTAN